MSESKQKRRIKRKLFLILIYASIIYALFKVYKTFFDFPPIDKLQTHYPVAIFKDVDTPVQVDWTKEQPKEWVDINQLPKYVWGAFMVSEDWEFFNHRGFDYNQIQEAILEDLKTGTLKRGGSTITQQLVKNLFLEQDKNFLRKYKELVLATEIEMALPKMKILETYLNYIEMGPGVYGLGKAARYYFKKSARELKPKEAAYIAMLLPSPKRYSVSFRRKELTRYSRGTTHNILRKMKAGGFISEETLNLEIETPLSFEKIVPVVTPEEATQETPLDEVVEESPEKVQD